MISEYWTAIKRDEKYIYFEVKNTNTNTIREEKKFIDELPLMFIMSGYPETMGEWYKLLPLPWSFKKRGEHMYIQERDKE